MADPTPPDDLVTLKAQWYAADALCRSIAAEEPRGEDTISIRPITAVDEPKLIRLFSDEQNRRLNDARDECLRLALEIHRNPWKAEQADRHAAERALNEAAWSRFEVGDGAIVGAA